MAAPVFGLGLGLMAAHGLLDTLDDRRQVDAFITVDAADADLRTEARIAETAAFAERVAAGVDQRHRAALPTRDPLAPLQAKLERGADRIVAWIAGRSSATPAAPASSPGERARRAADLSSTLGADGRSLTLHARATTAAAATALAQTAAQTLIADRQARGQADLEATATATERAIAESRRAIVDAEHRLAAADPATITSARRALSVVDERLEAASAALVVREADLAELQTAIAPPLDVDALAAQPRSDALVHAATAFARAEERVLELGDTYGERHPVMLDAIAERGARRAALARAADDLVDAVSREVDERRTRVAALEQTRRERAAELAMREADRRSADALAAKLAGDEERLAALIADRAQLQAALAVVTPDAHVRVVSDPKPAPAAMAPLLLYGFGGGLGLVLGTGAAALAGRGGGPVRQDDHLADADLPPVLATLPRLPRAGRTDPATDDAYERLALRLRAGQGASRTLALGAAGSSIEPLLVAIAVAGKLASEQLAVLVLDLTADRASLPRGIRASNLPGLEDVLATHARWSEALLPLGEKGPWLLAARAGVSALMATPAMDRLLAEATRRFDRVLIAAPPLTGAAGLKASRLCDRTLILARRAEMASASTARVVDELADVGATPAGFIVIG